jgi:uncharacterized protein YbjT (DUF2867 family)
MAAPKGTIPPNAGKGRPPGTPNKATATVREAIALFAEQNVGKLQGWLDRVATRDPAKAADLFARVLEYHIPKLARTETTVEGELTVATRLVIKRPGDA